MGIQFAVRYDGRDADQHVLDMRLLGQSMVGLDKVIHDSLFLAVEGRLPLQRQRLDLVVKTSPPQAHCVDLAGIMVPAAGVLPFVYEMLVSVGSDFIFQSLSYVLKQLGGRPNEADAHLQEMTKLVSQMHDGRLSEAAAHREETQKWREFTLTLVDRLRPAAKQIVAPIGPSCDQLSIGNSRSDFAPTVVDVPMADAVRSNESLIVGDVERLRLRVDGLIKHSRLLKVEDPQSPGRYISAEVRDPAFEITPNVYTEALDGEGFLDVYAKATFRPGGELVRLHILHTG